jgi:hypothetical protein
MGWLRCARSRGVSSSVAFESTLAHVSVAPVLGDGLVVRRIRVAPRDVVFFKGIIEGHEGLCVVFARAGGDLVVATTHALAAASDALLEDLGGELEVEYVTADS